MHSELRHEPAPATGHLIALADEGRFVAAAARVHLSQAAFSRSIQALEAHPALRLLERGLGGAHHAGRPRARRARERSSSTAAACNATPSCCAAHARRPARRRVDSGGGAGAAAAGRTAPAFAKVVARVRHGNVASSRWRCCKPRIDFFVGDKRMLQETVLATVPLAKIGGALYVRRGHPLAGAAAVSPAELARFGIGIVRTTVPLLAYVARALGFAGERSCRRR
ncbi:MAG: LysR family transcriptional regulator [Rubrivivax sp.]